MRALAWLFVFITAGVGCGADDPASSDTKERRRELKTPSLSTVSSRAAAGDVITILGQNFADPELGKTQIVFEGTYRTEGGGSEDVELVVEPKYENQGTLEWRFGPNIPFSDGDQLGVFHGTVRAINVGEDGDKKRSRDEIDAEIEVLPSILIRDLRPVNAGCPVGITETVEGEEMILEVETVGLTPGEPGEPMTYIYTFMTNHFDFREGILDFDPEDFFGGGEPVTIIQKVSDGNVGLLGDGIPQEVVISRGGRFADAADRIEEITPDFIEELLDDASDALELTSFSTVRINDPDDLPENPDSYEQYRDATISVVAIDSEGRAAKRQIPLRIWVDIEIDYDGNQRMAETENPVMVGGCHHGGNDIPRELTYQDTNTQTKQRGYRVNGHVDATGDLWIAKLTAAFDTEVNGTVISSQQLQLSEKVFLLPGEWGVFYRQAVRLERVGKLRRHGACGDTESVGEVFVNDWEWSLDFAKKDDSYRDADGNKVKDPCPPPPETELEPAQEFSHRD